MARWRPQDAPRAEAPFWYRVYDPAAWDEPDSQEQAMIDGSRGYGVWPEELHEIHSRRRWGEAKYRYRRDHPALAEQEFTDLVEGYRERHRAFARRGPGGPAGRGRA
jgi:hypothetical protein